MFSGLREDKLSLHPARQGPAPESVRTSLQYRIPTSSSLEVIRRHGLLIALLLIGVTVRVLVMSAYPPALFFDDSWDYIATAFTPSHAFGWILPGISSAHPSGYPALIRLLTFPGRDLIQLVAIQHLAGIATGVLVYLALVRAHVSSGLAACAAAAILLDGYAITLEQYVMADTFFTLTVLLAALVLAWPALRPDANSVARLSLSRAAVAGALVAAAVIQREVALFTAPVFVAYLIWRRVGLWPLAAFLLTLGSPLITYASAEHAAYGSFAMSERSGWQLYGRIASFADCAGADIPLAAKPLCETTAQRKAHPDQPTWYIHSPKSPAVRLLDTGGRHIAQVNALLEAFDRQIILHQPLQYVEAMGSDILRYLAPGATPYNNSASATSLPSAVSREALGGIARKRYLPTVRPQVRSPAGLVRAYRAVIHVPRPLVAAFVLMSLLALLLRTPGRREVLLLSGTGGALVVAVAATAEFSFRYLLPAVPLLASGGTVACRDAAARVGELAVRAKQELARRFTTGAGVTIADLGIIDRWPKPNHDHVGEHASQLRDRGATPVR